VFSSVFFFLEDELYFVEVELENDCFPNSFLDELCCEDCYELPSFADEPVLG
jgi:hypothetical protein